MILVLGATGFLGKRVCKLLESQNTEFERTSLSLGLDLRDQSATLSHFKKIKPQYILNCASFVGGIQFGYKYPADLYKNNSEMINNLFFAAKEVGVQRVVNPISNCVYPAAATLFKEEEIWDGPLHESVLVYGLIRKASWLASWAYSKQHNLDTVNIVLSNMYGPEDHFEEERSHALGALIMKIVKAKRENLNQVIVWGTGSPVREWLHVDDGAVAMIKAMGIEPNANFINIGVASGISIRDLAEMIKSIVGYRGDLFFDTSKPDGAAYKTVDGSRGAKLLGWQPTLDLRSGIVSTIEWYTQNVR